MKRLLLEEYGVMFPDSASFQDLIYTYENLVQKLNNG